MAELFSVAGSALSGGLFGVLGQVANRAFGVWETREKRKDTALAYTHELALIDKQMQAKDQETEHELDLTAAHGSWDGLKASLEAEARPTDSYRWVAAVRTLTRPFLTLETQVALVALMLIVRDRPSMMEAVIETITFGASASLLWWFGERASNPRGRK
jgi:hypothetical protein